MPQKVGKKVGIHFYDNVLSEINLPLIQIWFRNTPILEMIEDNPYHQEFLYAPKSTHERKMQRCVWEIRTSKKSLCRNIT